MQEPADITFTRRFADVSRQRPRTIYAGGLSRSFQEQIMTAYTAVHVALSLVGILTGLVVLAGFLTQRWLAAWNTTFLATTALTSATGFGFPFHQLLPSHIIGALSLVVLALAAFALYGRKLAGGWKRAYVITAVVALYFNVFVLVVQLFLKVPSLHAVAPTQTEPPFAIAQIAVLIVFVIALVLACSRASGWSAFAGVAQRPQLRRG
jgi:hypothetical protein